MAYRIQMPTEWTAEMALALPYDGKRYEVLDGELAVTPAPRVLHQSVAQEFLVLLQEYVRAHGLGHAYMSPADIEFSPRRLVQPDVFVVPPNAGGRRIASWDEVKELMLVIEVLSPSTARRDRVKKRAIYLEEGVPEYWIVDIDSQCIERWRQGAATPEICDSTIVWHPAADVPMCEIDLVKLFEYALQ